MKLFKKLKSNNQIIIKAIKTIGIIIIIIILLTVIYSLIFEQDKIKIDKYNFEQLEKVKTLLKDIPREQIKFRDLKNFNYKYGLDIKPIKNCYYMVSTNYFVDYSKVKGVGYIFGFKLESLLYRLRYLSINYAYPKYDLPYSIFCYGGKTCDDGNLTHFRYVISNPCED